MLSAHGGGWFAKGVFHPALDSVATQQMDLQIAAPLVDDLEQFGNELLDRDDDGDDRGSVPDLGWEPVPLAEAVLAIALTAARLMAEGETTIVSCEAAFENRNVPDEDRADAWLMDAKMMVTRLASRNGRLRLRIAPVDTPQDDESRLPVRAHEWPDDFDPWRFEFDGDTLVLAVRALQPTRIDAPLDAFTPGYEDVRIAWRDIQAATPQLMGAVDEGTSEPDLSRRLRRFAHEVLRGAPANPSDLPKLGGRYLAAALVGIADMPERRGRYVAFDHTVLGTGPAHYLYVVRRTDKDGRTRLDVVDGYNLADAQWAWSFELHGDELLIAKPQHGF